MGMLEKIFGRREQPAGLKNAQTFKLLEGYTPAFTTWKGSIYESELIRAALDAWGRHAAKLKPNIKGSAEKELQNRMKVRPNAFQEWSKFLYWNRVSMPVSLSFSALRRLSRSANRIHGSPRYSTSSQLCGTTLIMPV